MGTSDIRRNKDELFFLDTARPWLHQGEGEASVYYPRRTRGIKSLLRAVKKTDFGPRPLVEWVEGAHQSFALGVVTPEYVFLAADKIRSIPIFYVEREGKFYASNSARPLRDRLGLEEIDEQALLEFRMAGYVTGPRTVYADLRQLQAGEYLFWDRTRSSRRRERYFCYNPVPECKEDADEVAYVERLATATDQIFTRVAERVGERPVWVPLSGGLDSRLVLCKLQEHGVPNIQAFSYGPERNHEARTAQQVAKRLGVPWFHFQPSSSEVKAYFRSEERREYWRFADGLSVVPDMGAASVLVLLRREGRLPSDAVLINGQAGDFISGNHIPPELLHSSADPRDLLDSILDKHFSLWKDLREPRNDRLIENHILKLLDELGGIPESAGALASTYELWEWQERQSKYVANGQRLYEYLSLDWELPLWDEEYIRFWWDVPLNLRYRQRLYRNYLRSYDYRELFGQRRPTFEPRATPGWLFYPVQGLRKFLEFLGMKQAAATYRAYARYVGYYRSQYQSYSLVHFLKHAGQHRNPTSFFAETWVQENLGLSFRE